MTTLRKVLSTVTIVVVLAVLLSTIAAVRLRAQYRESCGQLEGAPGLLQKVGLLNIQGSCQENLDGTCFAPGTPCFKGRSKQSAGVCTTVFRTKNSNSANCICN